MIGDGRAAWPKYGTDERPKGRAVHTASLQLVPLRMSPAGSAPEAQFSEISNNGNGRVWSAKKEADGFRLTGPGYGFDTFVLGRNCKGYWVGPN